MALFSLAQLATLTSAQVTPRRVSQRGQKTIPVQPRVHPGRATATFFLQFFFNVGFGADDAGLAPSVQRRSAVLVAL